MSEFALRYESSAGTRLGEGLFVFIGARSEPSLFIETPLDPDGEEFYSVMCGFPDHLDVDVDDDVTGMQFVFNKPDDEDGIVGHQLTTLHRHDDLGQPNDHTACEQVPPQECPAVDPVPEALEHYRQQEER